VWQCTPSNQPIESRAASLAQSAANRVCDSTTRGASNDSGRWATTTAWPQRHPHALHAATRVLCCQAPPLTAVLVSHAARRRRRVESGPLTAPSTALSDGRLSLLTCSPRRGTPLCVGLDRSLSTIPLVTLRSGTVSVSSLQRRITPLFVFLHPPHLQRLCAPPACVFVGTLAP